MAYQNFHKHCKRCKLGEACKRSHVYVLQLEDVISDKKWFQKKNPDYKDGMDCLYVGKTTHHPRCRLSMHENCKPGEWEGKTYECVCWKKKEVNYCTIRTRASAKVANYITGKMRPTLYKKWNPQRAKDAGDAEKDLADDLRAQGYGVWTN